MPDHTNKAPQSQPLIEMLTEANKRAESILQAMQDLSNILHPPRPSSEKGRVDTTDLSVRSLTLCLLSTLEAIQQEACEHHAEVGTVNRGAGSSGGPVRREQFEAIGGR